jgi:hypothetical protein
MRLNTTFKNFLNENSGVSGKIQQIAKKLLSAEKVEKITGAAAADISDLISSRRTREISVKWMKVPLGQWEIGLFDIDGEMMVRVVSSYDGDTIFYITAR